MCETTRPIPGLTYSPVGGLYGENTPPTDLADRIAESNPKIVAKLYHKRIIPKLAEADAELLSGLKKAGFNAWSGPEGAGFLMSRSKHAVLRRHG